MAVNQLKAGVILNYIALGLNGLVGLLYTPYMLRMMGQSEYGLYSIVASVIAYLTIMDFGFGNAIIRYTAKFRAEGKQQEQYAMFGMFFLLYIVIGIIASLVGLYLYHNVELLFGRAMTPYEVDKARILLLILVGNVAITFPLSIFGSIITAYEDFVFQKLVRIGRVLFSTVVMIGLLSVGYKAIAMAIVQTVFNIATLLANYVYCKRKLKIHFVFGRFNMTFLREVSIYSFWIFLNVIMDRIYWSTGQIILGAVAGTVAVAVYAVAVQLEFTYQSFSTAIAGVFLPRVTALVTRSDTKREISDLFIKTGRTQYIVIAFILCGFILFGRPFVQLWAGDGYEDAYTIALMFFVATIMDLIQNLGMSILMARNEMKFRSVLYVSIAIVGVLLSIPMASRFGGVGCAAVSSVAIVIQHIILNVYYQRKQEIDIVQFWKEIGQMSIIPGACVVIGLIITHFVNIDSLPRLFWGIVFFSMVYLPLFYHFSMNGYERNLCMNIVRKLLRIKNNR